MEPTRIWCSRRVARYLTDPIREQCLAAKRSLFFFFFNDTATTEIYTLSLHDALPISLSKARRTCWSRTAAFRASRQSRRTRSEEHTSELQSRLHLVCRLLLEKKIHELHAIQHEGRATVPRRIQRSSALGANRPLLIRL